MLLLCGGLASKRGEGRGLCEVRGKILDVNPHRGMPEVFEVEVEHFLKGPFCGPMLEGDTVSAEKQASAIVAQPAMDKELLLRMLLKQGKELHEFFVIGRRPAAGRNILEMHSQGFDPFAFFFHCTSVLSAKVHDSRDSQLFELLKAFPLWLGAAIERIIELPDVRHARDLNSFSKGRKLIGGGRNRRLGRGPALLLRKEARRKQTEEEEDKQSSLHDDCSSSVARNATAQNRGRKTGAVENQWKTVEIGPLQIDAVRKCKPHFAFFS